ncbi:hypothetical protein FIBSPDRAFT_934656 [Athelia psychrophila]|uniref:Uncharacterized protein n=1 Tax=Athelia psychrophila TaxID=1759441 RepID=A0A166F167_9AGAM|nr:hypothetical protein FIBSPDRAFT_934656 [Fibularhizoctonia sp. CBS 109695]
MEGALLYFNNLDERVTAFGISRIPFSVEPDPEAIRPILRAAVHYHWHLNCNSTLDKIFAEDDGEYEDNPIWNPDTNPVNLYAGCAINLVIDTGGGGGVFTIGYGFTGTKPMHRISNLPDGQDITVGFLKTFFTTQYVDFSNIPQPTPFIRRRADVPPTKVKPARWDTTLIPQVQRRSK